MAPEPISIFTLMLEKVYGPAGPQLEISSKEAWKNYTLFGQKHTLLGSGVSRALTKKIYNLLFLHCQNPLAENGTARQRKPRNENLGYRFHYHCHYRRIFSFSLLIYTVYEFRQSLEVAEDKAKN